MAALLYRSVSVLTLTVLETAFTSGAFTVTCVVVRGLRRLVPVAATAVALAIMLPGASDARTTLPQPTLKDLVAQANQLSDQITSLGQQYDGLKIQLGQAESEEKLAQAAVRRDNLAVAADQQAVATLAAGTYMNGGLDPTLQVLTDGSPEQFLGQASI